MRILTDFHHSGLLNSLVLLFEKRLKHSLFRPIGRQWYEEGFWDIYDNPATVAQYLDIGGATPDNTPGLNKITETIGEVYLCQDIDSGEINKAITYKGFMNNDFDIVIASVPQHIEPFKRLCNIHFNNPKLIYQVGNAWKVSDGIASNIMASAIIEVPPEINFVQYHQEFDLDVFLPDFDEPQQNIFSFVNNFANDQMFTKDWRLFLKMEKLMPNWNFRSFGGQGRDGWCNGAKEVAKKMKESMFVWHTKAGGDGYGHIVYNTGAVARPMLVKSEYYRNKMGMELMIDGVTCVSVDGLDAQQVYNKINHFSAPPRYNKMRKAIHDNFTKKVNFNEEEKTIRSFLNRLV